MFQVLVDCALEPKTVMSGNVAKSKNKKTHALHHHLEKYDPFHHSEDKLLLTAYGYHTLGNPRIGLENHLEYIDAKMLSDFILNNVTPERTLIVANGVNNHQEFVSLCKERLGDLLPVPEHQYKREAAQYIGGEYRNWTETPNT
jgi:predicted Zn-dependent peptidase